MSLRSWTVEVFLFWWLLRKYGSATYTKLHAYRITLFSFFHAAPLKNFPLWKIEEKSFKFVFFSLVFCGLIFTLNKKSSFMTIPFALFECKITIYAKIDSGVKFLRRLIIYFRISVQKLLSWFNRPVTSSWQFFHHFRWMSDNFFLVIPFH